MLYRATSGSAVVEKAVVVLGERVVAVDVVPLLFCVTLSGVLTIWRIKYQELALLGSRVHCPRTGLTDSTDWPTVAAPQVCESR
jgi:hypothetical protein